MRQFIAPKRGLSALGVVALSVLFFGCAGRAGAGGGGGYIFVPCQGDADCKGGTCVNGTCNYAKDATIDGNGSASGSDTTATGDAVSSSSGGDAGTTSGGSSGGDTGTATDSGPAGGCKIAADCDDSYSCTTDLCSDGKCVNNLAEGSCLIDGQCYKDGAKGSKPCKVCSATKDAKKWSIDSGASCDDGDKCSLDDKCNAAGVCKGTGQGCCTKDNDCVSSNPCKVGACNIDTKLCEYGQKPGCCEQDSDCSTAGVKPCQTVYCNSFSKTCDVKNKTDGDSCEDGDGCTSGDKCVTGLCVGSAKTCDDGNKCTDDSCSSGQCVNSPIPGCAGSQCSSGTCCSGTGQFLPKGTNCGTSTAKYEYQCSGKFIRRRAAKYGCSGTSSTCSTSSINYVWGPWTTYKTCTGSTVCKLLSSTSATCSTSGGTTECTSGLCCDTVNKKLRPIGYKCSSSTYKYGYKCNGARYALRRPMYRGCTGKSASLCSTSTSYLVPGAWTTYSTCTSGKTCYQSSSTSSAYCKTGSYCSSGSCCYTSNKVKQPKYTQCSTSIKQTQYRCFGGHVQYRRAYYGCSGASSTCSSSSSYYHWTDWKTYKYCNSGTKCQMSGTVGTCTSGGGSGVKQCTSGTCCNTLTGRFRTKGEKCGTSIKKYDYRCSSAGGKYVQRRRVYNGCSGYSSVCSSSSYNYHYENWATYKSCIGSQKCYQVSSSSASCTSSTTTGKCSSGSCCDFNKYYKPRYSKCGTSIKKYEYKCSTTGTSVQRRRGYQGCTGYSTSCYTSSTYYYWEPWATYLTCTGGKTCHQTSSTSASCK